MEVIYIENLSMTSKFLYHESCPQCNSKDNLGVFDDGHKWCFGCGYFEAGHTNVKAIHNPEQIKQYNPKAYPYDADNYIPAECLRWLVSCNIGYDKIARYGIQYSPSQQVVCWKVKAYGEKLLGWQGRTFNPTATVKYLSHGNIREEPCILGNLSTDGVAAYESEVVVLCEDYLSAINIAEMYPAIPLFGCTCHLNVLQGVAKRFKQVWVWLDSDKLDNARQIAFKASLLGLTTRVIYTAKDPKYYSKEQIMEIVK